MLYTTTEEEDRNALRLPLLRLIDFIVTSSLKQNDCSGCQRFHCRQVIVMKIVGHGFAGNATLVHV